MARLRWVGIGECALALGILAGRVQAVVGADLPVRALVPAAGAVLLAFSSFGVAHDTTLHRLRGLHAESPVSGPLGAELEHERRVRPGHLGTVTDTPRTALALPVVTAALLAWLFFVPPEGR